jgi:hypothetical protein
MTGPNGRLAADVNRDARHRSVVLSQSSEGFTNEPEHVAFGREPFEGLWNANQWPDQTVMGVIVGLVVIPPFLVGSVYPWAFASIEFLVLVTVLLWMSQAMVGWLNLPRLGRCDMHRAITPILLFLAIVAMQLAPLPP